MFYHASFSASSLGWDWRYLLFSDVCHNAQQKAPSVARHDRTQYLLVLLILHTEENICGGGGGVFSLYSPLLFTTMQIMFSTVSTHMHNDNVDSVTCFDKITKNRPCKNNLWTVITFIWKTTSIGWDHTRNVMLVLWLYKIL